jgi:hypothetical protein
MASEPNLFSLIVTNRGRIGATNLVYRSTYIAYVAALASDVTHDGGAKLLFATLEQINDDGFALRTFAMH